MRWSVLATVLAFAACSPGKDGSWVAVEHGLRPAELRVVRTGDDGTLHAVGYHTGSLTGVLLQGRDGTIGGVPVPDDLLWDYSFVDLELVGDQVLWAVGTAHLLRLEAGDWDVWKVPDDVVDGVTAASFTADHLGWIVGQGWDGPHIYRFTEGDFVEEPIGIETADVSLASLVALPDGVAYAAGARLTEPQEAVLLRHEDHAWWPADLPLDAAEMGSVRDLAWEGSGPGLRVVGDRLLRIAAEGSEAVEVEWDADFIPRVGAFPDTDEGWIAGFGERPIYHWRWGEWEAVPPARLGTITPPWVERTWLVDDAHFASPELGWMVASYVEYEQGGTSISGEALLRFSRDDDGMQWSPDGTWGAPHDTAEMGPQMAVTAVAVDAEGSTWLAGDAAGSSDRFVEPQLWSRGTAGDWVETTAVPGMGLHDLLFDGDGSGWAVGSGPGEGDYEQGGVLRWDGEAWLAEDTDEVASVDWELYAVAEAPGGDVHAVGRTMRYPLAVARVEGQWQTVPIEGLAADTTLLDVSVAPDGTVWVAGTTLGSGGAVEGFLARGDADGLERLDVEGRECGATDARVPCWSLEAIDASGGDVWAVGDATALTIVDEQVEVTPTNMTLIDVARDAGGQVWVLAENGWWCRSDGGWVVRRHWDDDAGEGVVRRLEAASDGFEVMAATRELDGDLLEAALVVPR